MFEHEGLSKEFEWVTKDSEKNILATLFLEPLLKCRKFPMRLSQEITLL